MSAMIPLKPYEGRRMVTLPNGDNIEMCFELFRAVWEAHHYNCSGGYGTQITYSSEGVHVRSVYAPPYHGLDRTFDFDGALVLAFDEQAVPPL